eukprot:GHVU01007436.1.p1 GENE.GHVU01007436.1~~GHVU01007436.1.p1  ORF type:complete len:180 (-),score=38.70 GHVU01007436.1:275-814(-)
MPLEDPYDDAAAPPPPPPPSSPVPLSTANATGPVEGAQSGGRLLPTIAVGGVGEGEGGAAPSPPIVLPIPPIGWRLPIGGPAATGPTGERATAAAAAGDALRRRKSLSVVVLEQVWRKKCEREAQQLQQSMAAALSINSYDIRQRLEALKQHLERSFASVASDLSKHIAANDKIKGSVS